MTNISLSSKLSIHDIRIIRQHANNIKNIETQAPFTKWLLKRHADDTCGTTTDVMAVLTARGYTQANTELYFDQGNIDGLPMFWDTTDFCMKLLKAKFEREKKNSNVTGFGKWSWLCCTQTGSWGQRGMETQRKDVRNQLYSRRLLMMGRSGSNVTTDHTALPGMLHGMV